MSFGKPIVHYDKHSSGAAAYELLAQEVMARVTIPTEPREAERELASQTEERARLPGAQTPA